ncbi:MAG: phosphatidate cytidylyltransferase [Thermoanaerobacteraceae bacterium]|nr:phosphatidate cytidylyltransferase [Thermoanaerobacteraceae bacterium]
MKMRVLSAILGLPFSIFLIITGGNIFNFFVYLIALIAMREFFGALKLGSYRPMTSIGYISISFLFLIIIIDTSFLPLYLFFLTILYLICMIFSNSLRIEDVALSLFGVLYIGMLFGSIILLRQSRYGELLTFYLLILSWGTDTFAFLTGKLIGRHKLIPKISPNKTIEGAIGGLIASSLLSIIYIYVIVSKFNILLPDIFAILIVSLIGSLFSQLGDLSASAIKRQCRIKDFGNIIPGHGGILDRFDGLIFTSAYLYILLYLYNRFMFI